jgi:hypothetical protein
MARFQLRMHGWSVSQVFIPEGAIIDTDAGTDDWSKLVRAKGLAPPLSCQPLSQATYDQMKAFYGPDQMRWVVAGPGVVR